MSVSGIGYRYYQDNPATNMYNRRKAGSFPQYEHASEPDPERVKQNASAQDIYEAWKGRGSHACEIKEEEQAENDHEDKEAENKKEESDTEIIVKADGSKVMMTTVRVGGMETVMSMEIAGPTDLQPGNPTAITDDANLITSNTNVVIESVPEK